VEAMKICDLEEGKVFHSCIECIKTVFGGINNNSVKSGEENEILEADEDNHSFLDALETWGERQPTNSSPRLKLDNGFCLFSILL